MRNIKYIALLMAVVLLFAACSNKSDKPAENEKKPEVNEEVKEENNEAKEEPKAEVKEEKTEDKKVKEEAKNVNEELVHEVFVGASWVNDLLDGKHGDNYVIAEVTWGEAKDSPDYLKEHIPGAIHINTDSIEEGPVWNIRSDAEIEKAMLDYGITSDTTLLIYGPDTGAHRVAFVALYAGVKDVKVLDGGLNAWKKAGFETEADEVAPVKAENFGVTVPAHKEYWLSLDDAVKKLPSDDFRLISIRSEEEWLGETSGYGYIPKAGEPSGAYWGKSGEGNSGMGFYQNEDGTNKPFDEIVKMWEEQGITTDKELSFYCGTGWRACLPWLLCYERGLNANVFDGGWNEWQMHDELDAQVGDPNNGGSIVKVKDLPNDKAAK